MEKIVQEYMDMGYSRELAYYKTTMGGLKIITTIDPRVQKAIDDVYSNPEKCSEIFGYKVDSDVTPQSAIVIMAPDGGIRGLSGGLGKKAGNLVLDRTTVPRQPGSSIKPIAVYAPAIDSGLVHASTIYKDGPMSFSDGWSPKNSYSDAGDKTVQVAIQRSSNRIAAQVLRDLGVNEAYSHLKNNLNITSLSESDKNLPALSLGGMTKGISPIEMAAAYAPFINKGVYVKPHIYTKVYDKKGKIVLRGEQGSKQVISAQTAYIMTELLRRVVTSGTGGLAAISSGVFTAGKTGTTDDNKDKWFVGFTPNYVCAVWHGYDRNQVVSTHTSGSQQAFSTILGNIHKEVKTKSISAPRGITMISVCSKTGKRASDGCTAISLPFTTDNKPTKTCDHKEEKEDDEEIVDIDDEETEEE